MPKNIKKEKRVRKCILCDRSSPNPYGECFCSYELVFFSGNYKKIAERLAIVVKQQFNFITNKK